MTTEKWVWIGVGLLLMLSGYAIRGMIHSCPPRELSVTIPTQIKWDTVSVPYYPAKIETVGVGTDSQVVSGAESSGLPPTLAYSMDTTRPMTATIITQEDTVDALTFARIQTTFRDGAFWNTRLSLSPMNVNLPAKDCPQVVCDGLRGGLGLGWIQPFGRSGAVQLSALVPVNDWLALSPSGVFGSWTGVGMGLEVHW